LKEQEQAILSLILNDLEYMNHSIDNEKVMKVDVQINSLEDFMMLPYLLEDDIVIHGVESDVITTKRDMYELGLG